MIMSVANNKLSTVNGEDAGKKVTVDVEDGNRKQTGNNHFDVNRYTTHKTLTTGAMNISLLTSNANQIKLVYQEPEVWDGFRIATITLLGISVLLQFIVVFFIIIVGTSNADVSSNVSDQEKRQLEKNNKAILGMTAAITLINVLGTQFANKAWYNINLMEIEYCCTNTRATIVAFRIEYTYVSFLGLARIKRHFSSLSKIKSGRRKDFSEHFNEQAK